MSELLKKRKIPLKVVVATVIGGVAMLAYTAFSLGFGGANNFVVPTASMLPTVLVGDRIRTWDIDIAEVKRGQLVIYNSEKRGVTYVKRVIGIGGDVIKIAGQEVYINGKQVPSRKLDKSDEPEVQAMLGDHDLIEETIEGNTYQVLWRHGKSPVPEGEFTVSEGHVFMLGDNRSNSMDSRTDGASPIEEIFGSPHLIYFSAGEAGVRWHRIGRSLH